MSMSKKYSCVVSIGLFRLLLGVSLHKRGIWRQLLIASANSLVRFAGIALESFARRRVAGTKNVEMRSSASTSTIDCLENKANLVVASLCTANCIPARVPFQIILRGRTNLWSDNITSASGGGQSCFQTPRHCKQHTGKASRIIGETLEFQHTKPVRNSLVRQGEKQ